MTTLIVPSPNLARWVARIATLGLAIDQLTTMLQCFRIEAYLGVVTVLAVGVSLATATALFLSDARPVWVSALYVGVLNIAGYLVIRLVGLPLVKPHLLHQWSQPRALIAASLGAVVAGFAGWTLHKRRRIPYVSTPVTSAWEREMLLRSSGRGRCRRSHSGKTSPKPPG